mgnify:CR=1 FL=1
MFKDDLKQAMKNDHMSTKELANYLGVSQCTVQNWLSGRNKPKQREFRMVCELYELPIERYVGERSKEPFPWDGEKLKKLMMDRGYDVKGLASKLGINVTTPYRWLRGGTPSELMVNEIANLFNVAPEYFSKNVVGEFRPKPYVRPEVKKKVDLSKKPYKAAPIVNTATVDAPEVNPSEDLKDKMDFMAINNIQIQTLRQQIDDLNKTNEVMAKALNDLRKLVVEYLIKDEEPKKSWWQRMFG